MANYNQSKVEWCQDYMKVLRMMIFEKYDQVCSHILEYLDDYGKRWQEIENKKQQNQATQQRKTDNNQKPDFPETGESKDLKIGLWCSGSGKSMAHKVTDIQSLQLKIPR